MTAVYSFPQSRVPAGGPPLRAVLAEVSRAAAFTWRSVWSILVSVWPVERGLPHNTAFSLFAGTFTLGAIIIIIIIVM